MSRRRFRPKPIPRPRDWAEAVPQADGSWNIVGGYNRILVRGLKTRAAAQHWIEENER